MPQIFDDPSIVSITAFKPSTPARSLSSVEDIGNDPTSSNTASEHGIFAVASPAINGSWPELCNRYLHTGDLLDDIDQDQDEIACTGEHDDDEEIPLWLSTSITYGAPWQPTHRHTVKRFASWKDSKVDPGGREEAERLLEGLATQEKGTPQQGPCLYDKKKVDPIEIGQSLPKAATLPKLSLAGGRLGLSRLPEPTSAVGIETSPTFLAQGKPASTICAAYRSAEVEQRSAISTKNSPCRILPEGPFRLSKAGTMSGSKFGNLWSQMRGPALVASNAKMMSRRNRNCGHPIRELMKGSVAEERGNKAVAHSVIGEERRRRAKESSCVM